MRIIDSYVARHVAYATLGVIAVLVGLDAIFTLVDELDNIKGNYKFLDALYYMLLRSPRRVYEYLPIACLIGCLVGMGTLAANSELTVMRAAGLSIRRIAVSVLKPIMLIAFVGVAMGEYIIPPMENIAQSHRAVALGEVKSQSNKGRGYWHREGNEFMRFKAIEPNGILHGISIFTFDENQQLTNSLYAKRAIFQRNYWHMEDVTETAYTELKNVVEHASSKRWDSDLKPENLSFVMVTPMDMSMSDLYNYSQYIEEQGLNADHYMLSFWRKILQPLSTFALVILGISFIFGPLRSVTPGYRIFSGIIVGMLYRYLEELLAPASIVFGFQPIWATVFPIILCLVAGTLLMRRAA